LSRLAALRRVAPLWRAFRRSPLGGKWLETVRLYGPSRRARRTACGREVLPGYAAETGLAEECVLRLDQLGQHPSAAILAAWCVRR
jgi:hypothetical protein